MSLPKSIPYVNIIHQSSSQSPPSISRFFTILPTRAVPFCICVSSHMPLSSKVGNNFDSSRNSNSPETPELLLLFACAREVFQLEEDVSQVVHPQTICHWMELCPVLPSCLSHSPVHVSLITAHSNILITASTALPSSLGNVIRFQLGYVSITITRQQHEVQGIRSDADC